jgi:hypothetical protein
MFSKIDDGLTWQTMASLINDNGVPTCTSVAKAA